MVRMRLKSKVGPKGQAVIPKEVRDILGIVPGDEVIFEIADNEARLRPAGARSTVSDLMEIIPRKAKFSKDVDIKGLILAETKE
jgi:AbrB family looped-hinge helix DNA binding protein